MKNKYQKILSKISVFLIVFTMVVTQGTTFTLRAASEPLEITALSVNDNQPFPTMVTNSNNLKVQVSYKINEVAGGNGGKITIDFDNIGNYFTYAGLTGAPAFIDATNAVVSGNKVEIPLTGGTQNASGNFYVEFVLDRSMIGKIPDGTSFGNLSVTGDLSGLTSVKSQEVISATSPGFSWPTIDKYPVGDMSTDLTASILAQAWTSTPDWKYQPGSTRSETVTLPAGTIIVDASGGVVSGNTITWTQGPADANGDMDGFYCQIKIKFPSTAFTAGDEIDIPFAIDATVWGNVAKNSTRSLKFKIVAPVINMDDSAITLGPTDDIMVVANIDKPTSTSAKGLSINGINNIGGAAIPNTKVVWKNDADNTGKKLYPKQINVINDGVVFDTRVVAKIKKYNAGGDIAMPDQQIILPATSEVILLGSTASATQIGLADDEYIDQLEFYPKDAGSDALPVLAGIRVQLYFQLNPGGKYPNGTTIMHNDAVKTSSTLTWDGEDSAGGATQTVSKDKYVYYSEGVPGGMVSLQNTTTGVIVPGTNMDYRVLFGNVQQYGTTSNTDWKNPSMLFVLPDNFENLDLTQTLSAYDSGGNKISDATISDVSRDGLRMYKISLTPGTSIAPSDSYFGPSNYIPIKFKLKSGVAAGTYYPTGDSTQTPAKGMLLALNGTKELLPIAADVASTAALASTLYDDTTLNLDGRTDTTKLPYNFYPWQWSGYTVASLKELSLNAYLFDNTAGVDADGDGLTDGAWVNSNTPGAKATIPIGGAQGKFKLELANSGNVDVGGLKLYDIIPSAGNKTVINSTDMSSVWDSTFKSLSFAIKDSNGNDITGNYTDAKIYYSTQDNPAINDGGITRTGTTPGFTVLPDSPSLTELASIKSFYFDLGNPATFKLPTGAKVEIEGIVASPKNGTTADIGKKSYNSFAVIGNYYTNAGALDSSIPATELAKQTFELAEPIDVIAPEAPVINPVTDKSTNITGTGEPGATIVVTFPDNSTSEPILVNPDGTWTVPVPTGVTLHDGDDVTAIQTDEAGNESPKAIEKVTGVTDPIINPVTDKSTNITGTGEPGATIVVTFPDNSTSDPIIVKPDGTWTTPVPTGMELHDGDEIIATQTDVAGNESEATTSVTGVTDPTINPVTDKSTTITGTGEPGATIVVTFPDNSTSDPIIVKPDGTWTTPVPTDVTLHGGDEITAIQTDVAGNESPEVSTTVTDVTAPKAPVISPVTDKDTSIAGTGEPGAIVIVTFPNGSTSEPVTVKPDGTWTTPVPTGVTLHGGDEITATQTDKAGNESLKDTEIVTDTTAPLAPTINPVTDVSTTITGTGEPGAIVVVTFPDGSTSDPITVNPDGTWTTPVPTGVELNGGDEITAIQTDKAGNESPEVTAIVTDTTAPLAPTINPVTDVSTIITGTGEPGATIVVTFPDGTTTDPIIVKPDGTWAIPIPTGVELNGGDEITATQTDKAGNESPEVTAIVTDATAPVAPTINPVTDVSTTITGTGEPGATVVVTFPDGSTSDPITVNPDGTWTTPVPTGVELHGGDEITATQTDKAGNESPEATTTVTDVTAPLAPTINPVTDVSTIITGTGEPGATVIVTFPDGSTSDPIIVKPDGTWAIPIPTGVELHGGDEIIATQTDKAGNKSPEATTTVTDVTAPVAPTINPVTDTSTVITGTGEPGSTIVVTFPDGSTSKPTTVNPDGTWSVVIPDGMKLNAGDIITATATDSAGNVSDKASTTVIGRPQGDPIDTSEKPLSNPPKESPTINNVDTSDNSPELQTYGIIGILSIVIIGALKKKKENA